MKINLNNEVVFASTGGRAFEIKSDPLWFIHGSGQSHLSFILQGRFFANRGWPVIAADMPSHGLSLGAPLTSIEAMSDWQIALMDEIGIEKVQIIGHSQGGLIGLDMAHRYPDRVSQLSLVATALSIPVNTNLIEMAKNKEQFAIDAMIDWGHGPEGHNHDNTMPGQNHLNFGVQLMAANKLGALHADLKACVDYKDGHIAAGKISCPSQIIIAQKDKMTPMKFGLKAAEALKTNNVTVIKNAGHMLPSEHPEEVNRALRTFFTKS
jgi:pimeloyl-ACP methyl ester carboxylesterase